MRIIGGRLKGRKFTPPGKLPTRPTTDFAKEGLFNILSNYFDFAQIKVLDLFAGTGNISFEFASRGTTDITCVDQYGKCVDFIRATAKQFNIDSITVFKKDVFKFIFNEGERYDLIFADPPYDMSNLEGLPSLIFELELLEENGWFILEHPPKYDFSKELYFDEARKYGSSVFSFFRKH